MNDRERGLVKKGILLEELFKEFNDSGWIMIGTGENSMHFEGLGSIQEWYDEKFTNIFRCACDSMSKITAVRDLSSGDSNCFSNHLLHGNDFSINNFTEVRIEKDGISKESMINAIEDKIGMLETKVVAINKVFATKDVCDKYEYIMVAYRDKFMGHISMEVLKKMSIDEVRMEFQRFQAYHGTDSIKVVLSEDALEHIMPEEISDEFMDDSDSENSYNREDKLSLYGIVSNVNNDCNGLYVYAEYE